MKGYMGLKWWIINPWCASHPWTLKLAWPRMTIVLFLPAATNLGPRLIFLQACVCPREGGLPQCMLEYAPPGADTRLPSICHTPNFEQTPPRGEYPPEQTPSWEQTPPRSRIPPGTDSSIRSTSGRYASYWNAFLFKNIFPTMADYSLVPVPLG